MPPPYILFHPGQSSAGWEQPLLLSSIRFAVVVLYTGPLPPRSQLSDGSQHAKRIFENGIATKKGGGTCLALEKPQHCRVWDELTDPSRALGASG